MSDFASRRPAVAAAPDDASPASPPPHPAPPPTPAEAAGRVGNHPAIGRYTISPRYLCRVPLKGLAPYRGARLVWDDDCEPDERMYWREYFARFDHFDFSLQHPRQFEPTQAWFNAYVDRIIDEYGVDPDGVLPSTPRDVVADAIGTIFASIGFLILAALFLIMFEPGAAV